MAKELKVTYNNQISTSDVYNLEMQAFQAKLELKNQAFSSLFSKQFN